MQALYLLALDPIAETQADPNSYGFRRERCCADAIDQAHIVLSNRAGAEWILEGDIKSCFDRISHEWLITHIPMDKTILQKWLKAGYVDKNVFHETESGTPQGGVISPLLANIALHGMEEALGIEYTIHKHGTNSPRLENKTTRTVVRYADDVRRSQAA